MQRQTGRGKKITPPEPADVPIVPDQDASETVAKPSVAAAGQASSKVNPAP